MNAMNMQRMVDPVPTPTADEAQSFIAEVQRLTQFWMDGLLTDEEFQAAKAKALAGEVPAGPLLWKSDDLLIPLD
jgi:hypothetical protein